MTRRPSRRVAAVGLAAGGLALGLAPAGPAAAAEPATLRLLGSSPTYPRAVTVLKAGGGTVQVRPAQYQYRITKAGTTRETSGFCVDLSHYVLTNRDYSVELQGAADAPELAGAPFAEAGWLLNRSRDLIAAAADPQLEAGAVQVAMWQLSGQAADTAAPTSDPALNDRVAELRALAAGHSLTPTLAVDVAGDETCLAGPGDVHVTGAPGAEVDLAVTAGAGTVAPAHVTLDATGRADAELRASEAGDVTVTATGSAPVLRRAAKLPGQSSPQDQALLETVPLRASATQRFADCGLVFFAPGGPTLLPPPARPAAGAPPAAPEEAALDVTLDAPPTATPGGAAVYRLRVTNGGGAAAKDVRVAERLGAGLRAVSARGPRGTRARVARDGARWRVARLAPGRTITLTLRARVSRALAGDIGHASAAARAPRARGTARSAATTAVIRPVGKTEQGF
jgi:uncharacterized repeat protein (TIGR01451 family)